VAAAAADFARAALQALSRLEAAEATLTDLRERALAARALDDHELAAAFASVVDAEKALAQDLSGTGATGDLEQAMERATRDVEHLERLARTLPERLADARSELAEIDKLVTMGAEGFAGAVEKIFDPVGLRSPIDPSCLEGVEPALRPALARIEGDVAMGRWRAAAQGLDRWWQKATALRVQATEACEANSAPVDSRNELRGLLGVYRAMAGTMGMAEDPLLNRLHEEACRALYVAPCDLGVADRKVRIYIDAVNGQPPGERR
jgi:hypothetical protein